MARYYATARKANVVVKRILGKIPEENQKDFIADLVQLFNLGIRISPRGVQHQVRFNSCEAAFKDIPVKIGMKQVTQNGYSFNALTVAVMDDSPAIYNEDDE